MRPASPRRANNPLKTTFLLKGRCDDSDASDHGPAKPAATPAGRAYSPGQSARGDLPRHYRRGGPGLDRAGLVELRQSPSAAAEQGQRTQLEPLRALDGSGW